ncbi:hypothetical protein CBS147332_6345 [Penicillium roqueforti]|nr:hypothetical protein CBS147332_6345 [Penicillium roqueforti]KAI3098736.1 hypothetical protein CBS147331_8810 [Penicillium roqueforti]
MTTILFVPGAWTARTFYEPFLQALTVAGYDVHYAGYPSVDSSDPLVTDCQADTDAITTILQSLVEDQGKDVVLFLYSYGGMPGSAAATGLAKAQRAQEGKAGGVIGLLFLGAFIVPEGISCAGAQGGILPPWVLHDQPSANLAVVDDPIKIFAADVDAVLAQSLIAGLRPHATLAFNSPQPHPAWADEAFRGRLAFIVTTEDRPVPKEAQFGMMASTQQEWIVRELVSSHCAPFLNRIDETVELTREIIGQFL